MPRIVLRPTGAELTAPKGTPLRDLLFEQGVEFPCGGNGRCRGCRVRVLAGSAPPNDAQRALLSDHEIADGWRLACQCRLEENLVIELRQWDASILMDDSQFVFTPQEGLGIAIDMGTTTLVAQLLDLTTGHVLGVKTALNPQARFGGDVMSRIQHALTPGGQAQLQEGIRREIGKLARQLLAASQTDASLLRRAIVVGNTAMHHLFCGVDVEPLSHYPFEPVDYGLKTFTGAELGWELGASTTVQFLPCLGGFVGSDVLAGMLATGIHTGEQLAGLVDLGTNGEIVLATRDRMMCASTAAGPAFEGARISSGMRASTGAIWKVTTLDHHMEVEVLGNAEPRGICGSGLVDAVAAGLDLGFIKPSGRLTTGDTLMVSEPVALSQCDVRQLQLAKGAIAAGIRLLLNRWGDGAPELTTLHLAGAFGNYVNRTSARRIGLLAFPEDQVKPVGNTALLGAKIALFSPDAEDGAYSAIRARMEHVSLNEDPEFQDVYVDEMGFPAG